MKPVDRPAMRKKGRRAGFFFPDSDDAPVSVSGSGSAALCIVLVMVRSFMDVS